MLNITKTHSPVRTLRLRMFTCACRLALAAVLMQPLARPAGAGSPEGEKEEREAERVAIEQLTQTNQLLSVQ